jgi:hypothetical protein
MIEVVIKMRKQRSKILIVRGIKKLIDYIEIYRKGKVNMVTMEENCVKRIVAYILLIVILYQKMLIILL